MQVRPLGTVVPSPVVCSEVKVKEGCFIFPTSSRNWYRQGAAAAVAEEDAMAVVENGSDDAEASESAMMRMRRLALEGMVVMTDLLRDDEPELSSREGNLVII